MTWAYLQQLVQHALDEQARRWAEKDATLDYNHAISGLILQWSFGLRPGQVAFLQRNDFVLDGETGGYVCVKYQHKVSHVRPTDSTVKMETHVMIPEAGAAVKALLANHGKGDFLLGGYECRKINALIKRAAKRYKWPGAQTDLLNWVGHGLRHGAVGHQSALRGDAAAQATSAHKAPTTVKHYARDNSSKLLAVNSAVRAAKAGKRNGGSNGTVSVVARH